MQFCKIWGGSESCTLYLDLLNDLVKAYISMYTSIWSKGIGDGLSASFIVVCIK